MEKILFATVPGIVERYLETDNEATVHYLEKELGDDFSAVVEEGSANYWKIINFISTSVGKISPELSTYQGCVWVYSNGGVKMHLFSRDVEWKMFNARTLFRHIIQIAGSGWIAAFEIVPDRIHHYLFVP